MKKRFMLCIALALLLLLCACAEEAVVQATIVPTEEPLTEIIGETEIIVEATPEPTEEPTPEPTAEPTRIPKEGDIAVNFPDYDTGADADYSYQSDELRIAIKVHHESMPDQNGRMLNETYYVADIWVRNLNSFRGAFARGEFDTGPEEGDELAKRENAILAVNGNYNQGLTMYNGFRFRNWRQNKGWNSSSIGVIYKDGSFKTFQLGKESFDYAKELEKGAWHAWQFGPIIIRDYEKGPNATSYSTMGFKARNMLGYYEPGHYVIVTCDNRGDDARGMNEYMMVDVMKSLGVKDAFNLDGGVSSVMVFMGEIINQPTMHNGEEGRPIVDMLLFGEYDENGVSPDLSTLTPSKFLGR